MVFYKSGSLLPCIIAHAMIDVFSLFGADSALTDQIYVGATIVTAIAYCSYLAKLKNTGPAASCFDGPERDLRVDHQPF